MRPEFLVLTGVTIAAYLVGVSAERRSFQLAAAVVALSIQQLYMFREVGFF